MHVCVTPRILLHKTTSWCYIRTLSNFVFTPLFFFSLSFSEALLGARCAVHNTKKGAGRRT